MNAAQPDLPGMPPAASLVRSLRRPNLARLAAQIQICQNLLAAVGCRRALTASPILEFARTIFDIRFTHDDRLTLAALANLPVPSFCLPADLRPSLEDVRACYPGEADKARQRLEKMISACLRLEGSHV